MRRLGFTGDIWPDETEELLLRAALLPGDPGAAAWAAVRPRIDVDRLPGELHRLIPPLAKALAARGVEDPDLPRLKGVYQFSWYRNQLLLADAAVLLGALEAAGVATMLLRGAAMVIAYHGDAGIRPMNDLDVLVQPSQLEHGRRIAAAEGWRPVATATPLERREAATTLCNRQGRVVRMHWQPSRNLSLPDEAREPFWKRSTEVTVQHVATRVPSPAAHLVQACIDGARANSGSNLRWITDVAVLLGADSEPDWDVVVSEARRHHVALLVAEALRYLVQALHAKVPADAVAALAATPTSPRERLAHRLSLTTIPRVPSAAEVLGRFIRQTADLSLTGAAATAPAFLEALLGIERHRDLPAAVARKAVRVLASPTAPPAARWTAAAGREPARERP
jgi:putative nucleotidyltransferase-like protein